MRHALPASVAIHLALLGGAWLAFNWAPPPEETGVESVSVDIVSLEEFASTAASTVQSSATENLVAAGAWPIEETETVEPVERDTPEAAEDAEPDKPEPERPAEVLPRVVAEAEPVGAESLPVLAAAAQTEMPVEGLMPLSVSSIAAAVVATAPSRAEPMKLAVLQPVAPVAEPLEVLEPAREIVPDLVAPTPRTRPEVEKKPEPRREAPRKKPVASGGNGGEANANVAAAAPSGGKGQSEAAGNAAASKYPGLVQRALRRALRFPKGAGSARGEVQVTFVVSASGAASQIAVTSSSGHAVLDKEAVATVKRAAPFPPIPEGAGRTSWTFTMPLLFQR